LKEFTGRLRLGFTGAGGTGKGTLAKMVADYANLTFLPTPLAEIGTRFNMKDFKDHKTKDDVIAYQFAALHGQIVPGKRAAAGRAGVCRGKDFPGLHSLLGQKKAIGNR